MKKLDFYYRTTAAINIIRGIEKASSPFDKALVNFYVLKSKSFRTSVDLEADVDVKTISNRLENESISIFTCFRVMTKVLLHRLFYYFWLFRRCFCKSKYDNIIKTYVEVEYNLFARKAEGSNSLILVFPFPLSFRRQLVYLSSICKEPSVTVSLFGIPYSMKKLIRVFLCRNQLSIFELESDGAARLAEAMKSISYVNFLNMDDFEPFSVIYNEKLRDRGIYIDTYLHGVGTYSPFISTNHLKVFNRLQKEFYSTLNDISHISYYDEYNKENASLELINSSSCIIFYSQVTNSTLELMPIEKRVLSSLKCLASQHEVKLMYKKHPNLERKKVAYLDELDIGIITHIDRNKDTNVTGMSFYSTAFYTEVDKQSILISVSEIPVRLLFSESQLIVDESNLETIFG